MAHPPGLSQRLAPIPLWVVAALVVLHAAALAMQYVFGLTEDQPWRFLHYQFNLDREVNFATWVATLLLLAAAALLGLIAAERRWADDRAHSYWATLSVLFLLLSLDEMCSFHERLSEPVGDAIGTAGGIFTNAWVVVVVPMAAVVLAFFVPFLRALPAPTRWRFIAAGGTYVGGAAGVELVSGLLRDRYGYEDVRFAAATTFEELLELLGVAFFLRALTFHMAGERTLENLVVGQVAPAASTVAATAKSGRPSSLNLGGGVPNGSDQSQARCGRKCFS